MKFRRSCLALCTSLVAFLSACDSNSTNVTASQLTSSNETSASWIARFTLDTTALSRTRIAQAGWARATVTRNDSLLERREAPWTGISSSLTIGGGGAVTLSLTGFLDSTARDTVWTASGILERTPTDSRGNVLLPHVASAFENSGSQDSILLSWANLDSASITIGASAATTILGLIASQAPGIVVTYAVMDKNQSNVSEDFTISATAPASSLTAWNLGDPAMGNAKIKANSTLTASDTGLYSLRIIARNSTGTADTALLPFHVKAKAPTTSVSTTITLTQAALDSSAITIGALTATSIRGLIASDIAGITVTYDVLNKSLVNVNEDFTISTAAPGTSETSWSLGDPKKGNGTIKANSNLGVTDTGTYYLKIVTKNSAGTVDSALISFKVKAKPIITTPLVLSASGLNMGGMAVSPPSFLSIGEAAVYGSAATLTKYAWIDLFVTTNAAGIATWKSIAAGIAAYNDGDSVGTLTASYWGTGRTTLVTQVSKAPTSLEQAKTALAGITKQETVINTTDATSYYVVKTTEGVYAVLTVTNVTGAGASITFTLSILK